MFLANLTLKKKKVYLNKDNQIKTNLYITFIKT